MKLMIPDGDLAGHTECAHIVMHARPGANLDALFGEMLSAEEHAKLLWPREAEAGWIEPPVYRTYQEESRMSLVPEVFDTPAALEAPPHVVIGLWAIAKGTPSADDARACPGL